MSYYTSVWINGKDNKTDQRYWGSARMGNSCRFPKNYSWLARMPVQKKCIVCHLTCNDHFASSFYLPIFPSGVSTCTSQVFQSSSLAQKFFEYNKHIVLQWTHHLHVYLFSREVFIYLDKKRYFIGRWRIPRGNMCIRYVCDRWNHVYLARKKKSKNLLTTFFAAFDTNWLLKST